MKQVRIGVFETNSSSTHSIVICDKYLYDEWLEDRAYLIACDEEIVKDIPEDVSESICNLDFLLPRIIFENIYCITRSISLYIPFIVKCDA